MSKRRYDEVSVVRTITKNRSVNITGRTIEVDVYSGNAGNTTWGKIDYLCKIHGYNYIRVGGGDYKSTRKSHAPKIVNPNKKDDLGFIAKSHPAKINIVNMTKVAMKNSISNN